MPQVIPIVAAIGAAASTAAGAAGIGILGASALFGLTTVGGLIGFGLSIVGTVATSLLGSTSSKAQEFGSGLRQATIRESTRPRFYYFGRVKTGGSMVFAETTLPNGGGNFVRVIVTDCQPTDGIETSYLNGEEVLTDAAGLCTSPAKWAGKVKIVNRLGDPDQLAMPDWVDAFEAITPDHRNRGLTYTLVQQNPVAISAVNDTWPNGANGEQLTQIRRAAKDVYDPRDGQERWTRNGTLNLMWALQNQQFGGMDLDQFSLDWWVKAANICDEPVVNGNGNVQPRYCLSGGISAPQPGSGAKEFAQKVEAMLQSLDAALFEDPLNGGRIGIYIGAKPDGAVLTYGPDQIIGMEDQEGPGLLAAPDAVRVEYIEPELGYQETITPPFGRKADGSYGFFLETEADGLNITTVSLKDIDSWNHACRIAARTYYRLTYERLSKLDVNLAGVLSTVGSLIGIKVPGFPPGGLYRVTGRKVDLASGSVAAVTLSSESVHPNHEVDPVCPPLELPPLTNSAGVTVVPPTGLRAGATSGGRVRIAWAVPAVSNIAVQIEWGETGSGVFGGQESERSAAVGSREINTSTATGNVDIRVRFATGSNAFTTFTVLSNISRTTIIPASAAPALRGPSSGETGDDLIYQVTAADAANILRVELLVDGAVAQTKVVDTVGPHSLSASMGVGTHSVTARAINVSGVPSPLSAVIGVTIRRSQQGGDGGGDSGGGEGTGAGGPGPGNGGGSGGDF